MALTKDGDLTAATVKRHQVPSKQRVDAPGAQARFVGTTGGLRGWEAPVRVLQVTDTDTGREVNDVVDVAALDIVIEHERHGQLLVAGDDGYFTDVVGVLPPGVPTSEEKPGAVGEQPGHRRQPRFPAAPEGEPGEFAGRDPNTRPDRAHLPSKDRALAGSK